MNDLDIIIKYEILSETEEELIKRVAAKRIFNEFGPHKSGQCQIILRPLERVGTKPTKVFLTYFKKLGETPTRLFILKIAHEDIIKKENIGWNTYLKDHINAEVYHTEFLNELGAILYRHAGAFTFDDIDTSKELNDLLFSNEVSLEGKLTIFNMLYDEEMRLLNQGADEEYCDSLLGEYKWYLHENKSEKLLKAWLGSHADDEAINLFGHDITNPLSFMQKFSGFHSKTRIKVKNLHGDLHPRNVILDKELKPKLIDFEWGWRGHALKDYVLMENSIKFFQMEKTLPLDLLLEFEQILIDSQIEEKKDFINNNKFQMVHDAYEMIRLIRFKAKTFCLWNNHHVEYLCALYLVSYGLLYHHECNSLYCLISLGKIGEKLRAIM